MGDNRNANRNAGYRGSSQRNRTSSQETVIDLQNFPWQLFLAVGFAVIGIVIFSTAMTMFVNGRKTDNSDNNPPLYVSNTSARSDTVVAFDDEEDEVSSETSSVDLTNVEKADFTGTWQKTDVYESEKATLTITDQDELTFSFTMKLWNGKKTASVSGTAYFTGSNSAAYTKGLASIAFERGTQYISIYHAGNNADLGLSDDFKTDGKYTTGTPNYYKTEETGSYDYDVYQSEAVTKALAATLSADDYSLYKEMMTQGLQSPIAYERTVDKNGKKVNVDAELNCVKYYANLNTIGMDMIFICSNSGKIYVLFYDSIQIRYYTNDKAYSTKLPSAFQAVATAKKMTPVINYKP